MSQLHKYTRLKYSVSTLTYKQFGTIIPCSIQYYRIPVQPVTDCPPRTLAVYSDEITRPQPSSSSSSSPGLVFCSGTLSRRTQPHSEHPGERTEIWLQTSSCCCWCEFQPIRGMDDWVTRERETERQKEIQNVKKTKNKTQYVEGCWWYSTRVLGRGLARQSR